MSSSLARRVNLPHLSPRWTAPDAAAAQTDRNEGIRAARDGDDGDGALNRFWRHLCADAASDLLRLYAECARLLEDHNAKRERLRHELDTDLVNQSMANQRQHDERMDALKREVGPEAGTYKERAAKSEDAQKALRAIRGAVNSRPLRTQFGVFYYLMMLLLALAEVPVNRAAFELTFREEPIFSLMLAAAVGLILIFLAHVIGLMLRQWPNRPTLGQIVSRVVAMALLIGIAGTGVYFMAKMRQAFIRLTSAETDGFAERLQEALRGGGTQGTVSIMADLPLTTSDWTFIALNLLIFVFGVVASFLRHDPHPDYARAVRDARQSERSFGKIEKKYGDLTRVEITRYEERKRSLEAQMGELRATMAALADQSGGIGDHCVSARRMVAQTVLKRCGTFVGGFITTAPSGTPHLDSPTIEAILAELPTVDRMADAR